MKLPGFYQFSLPEDNITFLNAKLDLYKEIPAFWDDGENLRTINGKQTKNLLASTDKDLHQFLLNFSETFGHLAECKFDLAWAHMIEYDSGGWQAVHTHEHQEDFSVIIYLNDCEDGNTIFILNQDRDVRVTHKPIKGQGTIFLSNIAHYAENCTSNKRVFVCGLTLHGA